MTDKLLPCPFCGGKADYCETNAWWVRCNECNAETEADMSPEAAAEIWNRRAPPPQTHVALPETENRSERQSIKHNSVLSSDLETLSVDDVVCEDLLGDHLASSEDGFIVGNIKRGELQPHRVLLENIVPSDVEIVSGHAGSIELSDSNRNDAPRFQSSPLAPAQHVAGPQPCGIADPSTRDCPNMKEVGGGMDGERYRCDVCGKGYFLDYEEMK